jgi:hypothetical protein
VPLLTVRSPDVGTRIEILDPSLQPLALPHDVRTVQVSVDPGVYAVRFRRGVAVTEKLTRVARSEAEVVVTMDESEEPVFATAAPLQQGSKTDAAQRTAAEALSVSKPAAVVTASPDNGRLLIFLRADEAVTTRLDAGLTVHALTGEEVANAEALGQWNQKDRWAGLHLSLPAGAYRIRRTVNSVAHEQIVHVRHEWQTQYFAVAVVGGEEVSTFSLISLMMAHESQGFDGSRSDGRYIEAAMRALRERSAIPGPMSEQMLYGKFENPILGVLAALLQLRSPVLDPQTMRQVVDNLFWLMGPSPDVLAIGLALMTRDQKLREEAAFRQRFCVPQLLGVPPYFSESWRHICDATQWDATLMPLDSFSTRAAAALSKGSPWFRWRVTPEIALVPKTPAKVIASGGVFGALGDFVLTALNITARKIEAWSADTLGSTLRKIQDRLRKADDAAELLRLGEFSQVERRLADYVFPLTDPALDAVLASHKDRADDLREAVLARGRDGRELSRALQLPLGFAMIAALSLSQKLAKAVADVPTKAQVDAFVARENQGNRLLRNALLGLRAVSTGLRRPGMARALNALDYLALRYESSQSVTTPAGATTMPAATRAQTPALVDIATGSLADDAVAGRTLSAVQRALARRIEASVLRVPEETGTAVDLNLVAPLTAYAPGALFPAHVRNAAQRKRVRARPARRKPASKKHVPSSKYAGVKSSRTSWLVPGKSAKASRLRKAARKKV